MSEEADLSRLLDARLIGYHYDGWGELRLSFDNGFDFRVDNDDGAGFHLSIEEVRENP